MDFGASRVSSRTGEMGRLVMAAEAICTLYKPVANMMMDGVEGSNRVIDDELCEALMFSRLGVRITNCHCFVDDWLTSLRKSLMVRLELLFGMRTRRMDSRFGVDCTNSSHCHRE